MEQDLQWKNVRINFPSAGGTVLRFPKKIARLEMLSQLVSILILILLKFHYQQIKVSNTFFICKITPQKN